MKIRVYVEMGLVGCTKEAEIEVDDDLTEEQIEAEAREAMFEMIDWGYSRVEDEEDGDDEG